MDLVRTARRAACAMVTAVLLLSAAPAWADTPPTVVTSDVMLAGHDLVGMSAMDVRAAVLSVAVPEMAPLQVRAADGTFTVDARAAVLVDVDGMVAQAMSEGPGISYELLPRYVVSGKAAAASVATIAKKVAIAPVDSKRVVAHRRLTLTKSVPGRALDSQAAIAAVTAAVRAECLAAGATQPTVQVATVKVTPKVTESNIGRTIVVVLGERKLYLYKEAPLLRTFRCAIGQPKYPTPLGTFKVIAKKSMPSWTNPGSAWGKSMPAHIAPGPNNPLGLRALYLNSPGIRIHGTNNIGSIGTPASHGCMRLANSDIVKLYPLVPVGTPVYIVK